MSYDIYKAKLANLLRHYKVSESEYSFDGEKSGACIFTVQRDNMWHVCEAGNGKSVTRGMFYSECSAYDFVFYLVLKNHRDLKKLWW